MAKENPKCSRYDLRALEQWLTEQAANGKWLGEQWLEFSDAEPVTRQFYIEPAQERGGPTQALRDARALSGWEFVCTMDKEAFFVWRSVGERAKPPRMREMPDSWAYRAWGERSSAECSQALRLCRSSFCPHGSPRSQARCRCAPC